MAKHWDSFLSYCICNLSRQREVTSSMYALNECGMLIFKGLSLSYNEQGWCGSQIPSCTTSKDLEKQWSIAVWEIHACQSFKFFGRVSRSHCDWSDHSPLHVHLYVFTISSPSTLKVSQLNIFIVFTPHFKPSQCLWAPILQSLSLRLPVLLVLALPSRSLFTQYMESSLAPTLTFPYPFHWLKPFHPSSPHNCHALLIIITYFRQWSQHHLGLMTHCLGTYIWNLAKLLTSRSSRMVNGDLLLIQ